MYREYVKEYLSVNLTDAERVSYSGMIVCKFQQYLTDMAAWMYDGVVTSLEEDWEDKGFDAQSGMGIYRMSLKAGEHEVTITNVRELFRVIHLASRLGIEDHLEYEASYYYNATCACSPVFEDGCGAFCPANQYFDKLLKAPECAQYMTFRSIRQGEQLDDIMLTSSPAGSGETIYGDSVLHNGMDDVADIEIWNADMIDFYIHFPESTEEKLTQCILQQLRELGKKYFTAFSFDTREETPFDVDDYVDTYEGEYEISFSKEHVFNHEELLSFKDEVQKVAQLVLEAKGRSVVKGWLLSGAEKNLYAAAYMELDQDGKLQFMSAKL